MSDSPNVSVVRRLYQARGNPEVIRQVLASNVRWEVVEGFPYGGVYVGFDSVLGDFFGRRPAIKTPAFFVFCVTRKEERFTF
jgi:hypothetical protein